MFDISIKVKNYKCFKEEAGFDKVCRVNLIIGRNNVGKSSLLDIIEFVVTGNYQFDQATRRENQTPQIVFTSQIPEETVKQCFPKHTSGGVIRGSHEVYGNLYIGRGIKWTRSGHDGKNVSLLACDDHDIKPPLKESGGYFEQLHKFMPTPFKGKVFRKLLAERDIVPEIADPDSMNFQTNGEGLTNVIQGFINHSNLPSALVETDILDALNKIFAHDAEFTDIVCQLDQNKWEIYLEEEVKGRIALSKSGSGLKTVISVLACLILVPHIEKIELNKYVFGFEELENNVHPALLRRLNEYVYKSAIENGFIYFMTTHSSILIDQFSKQGDAQIIHVIQNQTTTSCVTANTYIEKNGVLDDLDVRASDLLQANGIVWVEGPSDRIYLNKWINLWSDGALKEGTHYQTIFYGGRLLSHLTAEATNDVDAGISILNTNRNAVMIMDSDKRSQQESINTTKRRIRDELKEITALCWITKGKEIENYVPSEIVDVFFKVSNSKQVQQYDSFFDHIDSITKEEGSKYINKKPLLAEKLTQHMTKENLMGILDLDAQMQNVCKAIEGWNN